MILSLLSGLISAFSLPTSFGKLWPDLGFLSWFSLVPLYLSIRKKRAQGSFLKGFVFGVFYFGTSLYWITIALFRYGDVPFLGSVGALMVLSCVLSIFTGLITYFSVWVHRRGGPIFWAFPLSWVSFEFLRNYFPFQGFPWANLAYSQRSFGELIQSLDIFGVYGIIFIIVLINASLGEVIYFFIREWMDNEEVVGHKKWGSPWVAVVISILMMVILCFYGNFRQKEVRELISKNSFLRVGLVQGNVSQDEKWLEDNVDSIIQRHIFLSEEVQKESPQLIIWPESSFPTVIPPEKTEIELLKNIQAPLLMGMLTYDGVMPDDWPPPSPQSYEGESFQMHNGAALIGAGGHVQAWYFKKHLVPMGEYIPFKKLFFFMDKIVPAASDFVPGKDFHLLTIENHSFGVTICYEDLFRKSVVHSQKMELIFWLISPMMLGTINHRLSINILIFQDFERLKIADRWYE
ncbi:MAG: apolipoprotein N-acyltransferase [Deltaproteobacteria bacterium]|nr:MAG: apolipoprotein N-acyltransferase [Deltaproteobacteria bacterium]